MGLPRPGKLKEKAEAQRRHKVASLLSQSDQVERLPGRTRVETIKVSLPTRRQYLKVLWLLACWVMGLSSKALEGDTSLTLWEALVYLKTVEEQDMTLDDMCAGWVDAAFWEGGHSSWGSRLASAVSWFLPRHQRTGAGHLPRLLQARTSAARRAPGGTRLPFPEELIFALTMATAYILTHSSRPIEAALSRMLCHHCYMRPGELYRLQWRHLNLGKASHVNKVSVTLHPAEESKASKSGEYDETIIIDEPWLVRVVQHMLSRRGPNQPVMPLQPRDPAAVFYQAQELLGLVATLGKQTLYVLRHSGASADAWQSRRTLEQIQVRGRWKSSASVRRYQKGGRVAERLAKCGDHVIKYAAQSEKHLEAVLCERLTPLRPP